MDLIIENVRCFRDRQTVPIKPLTFLVGENSTGKSTLLAIFRIVWDALWGNTPPNFNEEPFQLGTYDQIATYRGGRGGQAKSFGVGLVADSRGKRNVKVSDSITRYVEFGKGEAQPRISKWDFRTDRVSVTVAPSADSPITTHLEVSFASRTGEVVLPIDVPFCFPYSSDGFEHLFLMFHTSPFDDIFIGEEISDDLIRGEIKEVFKYFCREITAFRPRPRALAPIRSTPERVYSTMEDSPLPSGRHVPMVLRRLFSNGTKANSTLQKSILDFGLASGLFDNLKVKRFGQKEGDPFQILIGSQSPPFNLMDVGYGVSQVLPILVDALEAEKESVFLLQQPEVHLHPRAQAELGTFFGQLAHRHKKGFLIETHSDYMIDRVRMDIRDKKGLKPEDVVILYFEKDESCVNVHPIQIDENGNIQGAPQGYRRFFMEEERRYFGG